MSDTEELPALAEAMTLKPYEPGRDPLTGYVTRDGRKVRILATDLGGVTPIAFAAQSHGGENWEAVNVRSDGIFHKTGQESCWDLMCEPVQRTVWVNIYSRNDHGFSSHVHSTRGEADSLADKNRIACIPVTFTEGEGL